MGVDLTATVSVGGTPVCEVWCGRLYHWTAATNLAPSPMGCMTGHLWLRMMKNIPIHDGKVKDTDVYVIAKALGKKFGAEHITIKWEAT